MHPPNHESESDAAAATGATASGPSPGPAGARRWAARLAALAAYVVVAAMGGLLLPSRLATVRGVSTVGGADSGAYALQARSLAEGRGLGIPYITNYIHVYPKDRDRHDDHWPPLLSFAQAIGFRLFGFEADVPARVTVIVGALLLPLCFCALAHAATRRAWLGALAATPLLLSDHLFRDSREAMSDQLLAAVLCLFLAALLFARRRRGWLLLCGATAALAWYGKGSQILLFGFFGAAVPYLLGWRALLRREFLGALLLALALMFPRLRYNAVHFGRPLHSTQNAVAGFYGLTDHDPMYFLFGFYSIYWDRNLPSPGDRFRYPTLHARSMRRNAERLARAWLLGFDSEGEQDWAALGPAPARLAAALNEMYRVRPGSALRAELTGGWTPPARWPRPAWMLFLLAGAVWGLAAIALAPARRLWRMARRWRGRKKRADAERPKPPPEESRLDAAALLTLFVAMQAAFLIVFWDVAPRLTYPAVLPAWALGWLPVAALCGAPAWAWRKLRLRPLPFWLGPAGGAAACVALFAFFAAKAPALRERQTAAAGPAANERTASAYARLAAAVARSQPENAVVMCRGRHALLWHAPRSYRGLGVPYAPPADLLAVARYYGVTHIAQDWPLWLLPGYGQFEEMLRRNPRYFEPIARTPFPTYRIRWDRIPESWITPLDRLEPAWNPAKELPRSEEWLAKNSERGDPAGPIRTRTPPTASPQPSRGARR